MIKNILKTDSPARQKASERGCAEIDPSFLQQDLPAGVLKQLLDRLDIPVQTGALTHACEQAQKEMTEASPSQRINFIFHALQIRGVQVAQLRWTRFDQRRLPAMLCHGGSWKLIERGQSGQLILTDEMGETCQCCEADLSDVFVLWLHVQQKRETGPSLKGNLAARLLLREMFKDRRWLVNVTISTIIINVLAITTSLFALQVYDRVVPTLAYATLYTLVAGMAIMVSLDWLLKTLRARILDSVSCAVDRSVSQQVFDHVMRLQLDIRPRSLGTLAAQVGGLDSVKQFFTSGVIFALIDMPFALMFIAFIAIIGGPIGWVYLLLLPVAATLGWITQKRLRRLMREQMIRSNERQGLLVDAIQGSESIRANNATWRFSEQWREITTSISRYNIQQKAISNLATVSTGSLSTIAYVTAIVVGVGQIEAGNLTMGALIACSILGGRVIAPVAQSVQYLAQWQNIAQALQMVNQVLILKTDRRPDQELLMPDERPATVELEGVRFCYPESPIQQLNIAKLSFKAGDRVALIGNVGSGKSTLLKVLAGLYAPAEGRVRLGNADLWEMDPHLVAEHIGYLPQSVHLFKGTLRSNLTLSGAVSDSHLLHIAHELGIDSIAAENPRSMELPISEGGEGLSGGQRQLVGLARVFLAQPTIWLLDEPTASLDSNSEQQVLAAIASHIKADDILILSTHRPALITQLTNRVVVMQRGEISADGPPEVVLPRLMGKRTNQAHGAREVQVRMPMPAAVYSGNNRGAYNVI
ncbi:ATP-binding cassette domain-containing protein [Desulfotalea psychrophila]|uniref:Related to ATP-binding secretion protein n=1 Tax=Desulfotalea psychrophila (strain LSv54 / DSM 12343) TaxID=177439 RepID=Q6ALD8_DESPS|nr:ATP-binding cassette domain-containing protein [Desulfotalea psychrophila]CAG36837.1 related to ATP-binding secretion protein [Desulfotalea psychrophila LSv54]